MIELLEHVNVNDAEFLNTVDHYDIFRINSFEAAQNFTHGRNGSPAGEAHNLSNGNFASHINNNANGFKLYFITLEDTNAEVAALIINNTPENREHHNYTIGGLAFSCNFELESIEGHGATDVPATVLSSIPDVTLARYVQNDDEDDTDENEVADDLLLAADDAQHEPAGPDVVDMIPDENGEVADLPPQPAEGNNLIIDAEVIQDVVDATQEEPVEEKPAAPAVPWSADARKARFNIEKEPSKYQESYSEREFSRLFELVKAELVAWKADTKDVLGYFARSKKYNELVLWNYNEENVETPIDLLGTVKPDKKGQYTVFIDSWADTVEPELSYEEPTEGNSSGTYILRDCNMIVTIEPVGNKYVRITKIVPLEDGKPYTYSSASIGKGLLITIPESINGYKVIDIAPFTFTNIPVIQTLNIEILSNLIKHIHKYTFYWSDHLSYLKNTFYMRIYFLKNGNTVPNYTIDREVCFVDSSAGIVQNKPTTMTSSTAYKMLKIAFTGED